MDGAQIKEAQDFRIKMQNGKKYFSNYESPNIVIVPTVSFLDGPPAKKPKFDENSKSNTPTNITQIANEQNTRQDGSSNYPNKICCSNAINKDSKIVKNNNCNSWALNYLQSIRQLTTMKKKPIVCIPDKGQKFEEVKQGNLGFKKSLPENGTEIESKSESTKVVDKLSSTRIPLEIKERQENIIGVQTPKIKLPEMSDSLAKKQINEFRQNKTPRMSKKIIILPTTNQTKPKNEHGSKCFKSKLHHSESRIKQVNTPTEKVKNTHFGNQQQKIANAVGDNKINSNKQHDRSEPKANNMTKLSTENIKSFDVKTNKTHKKNDRVQSLLSSNLPLGTDNNQHSKTVIQINFLKRKSNNFQEQEHISDPSSKIVKRNSQGDVVDNSERSLKTQVHKQLKGITSPTNIIDDKNVKKQRNSLTTNKIKNTSTKKGPTETSIVIKSSKEKRIRNKASFKSNKKQNKTQSKNALPVKHAHKSQQKVPKVVSYNKYASPELNEQSVPTAKEVTLPSDAEHQGTGKIPIKKTILKSVVHVKDNFDLKVPCRKYFVTPPVVEDLRKKLNRAKKYRDDLIVSVPNIIHDPENKIKRDSPAKSDSSKPKVKTIKLIINLICKKTTDKKLEEEATKSSEDCLLPNHDLSFLDDFNVDDIVKSLNCEDNSDQPTKVDYETERTSKAPETSKDAHVIDVEIGSMCIQDKSIKTEKLTDDSTNSVVNVNLTKGEKSQQSKSEIKTEITKIGKYLVNEEAKGKTASKEQQAFTKENKICSKNDMFSSSVSFILDDNIQRNSGINTTSKSMTEINNVSSDSLKSNNVIGIDTCLSEEPAENDIKITVNSDENIVIKSLPQSTFSNTATSKDNFYNESGITYIDLTESEQIIDTNMQRNTHQSSANILPQSSNSDMENSETSKNIFNIFCYSELTKPEENELKMQQAHNDVTDEISAGNKISDSSSQSSSKRNYIKKSIDLSTQKPGPDKKSDIKTHSLTNKTEFLKIINNIEKACFEDNSKIIKHNRDKTADISNLHQHKLESINCANSTIKDSQVNANEPEKAKESSDQMSESVNKFKASASMEAQKDSFDFAVQHISQACIETGTKRNKHTLSTCFRKTPGEESLMETLKLRMTEYMGTNYDIGKIIHRGKYSKIFHCKDQNKNEYVVKVLHRKRDRYTLGIQKEDMLKAMQKDIPKDNQHFAYLINGFGIEGRWGFLMEYYPKNLRQALNERNVCLHLDEVQNLARQLVSAIIILRSNNIVHSDIKPEHILINNALDRLKLCGFDESRNVNQVILLPNIGTPSYRAPEVILGYSDGFSIDVWSTALVMFEMATNLKLFSGIYNNDILFQQMNILGYIPIEMIQTSIFKDYHFCGAYFKRRVGYRGKEVVFINNFSNNGISSYIYNAYCKASRQTIVKYKAENVLKLKSFCNLLSQMLVIDPKQRLPIEFVYSNPFFYQT